MNSSEGNTMKHRNTRRKKILIKKIEETTSHQVTLSKRHTRLFKKASELCVLTRAEMAILVQSPGGHCYAFRHPSVDVVIDYYDNNGSTSVSSPKQPSVTELNLQYSELEKELEREKRKYEMIQQEKIGKSSSEFVPWVLQYIKGMEVDGLEQYLAALVELKRKVLVRTGDLANMENASMLSLVRVHTGITFQTHLTMLLSTCKFLEME
ncbi:agamous-like MADS-box protein AGL62 [Tanacetum coccineum]